MLAFTNDLQIEIEFFEKHREQWCKQNHAGKYVVIHKERRIGDFQRNFEDAMKVGYDAGLDTGEFLVEVVLPPDTEEWVSHIVPGVA